MTGPYLTLAAIVALLIGLAVTVLVLAVIP